MSDSAVRVYCREETGVSGTFEHYRDIGRSVPRETS